MKIRSILFILGVTFSQFSLAQQTLPRDPDCCTSIMVGKLADFYNVSIDYLLGRTDNPEVNRN